MRRVHLLIKGMVQGVGFRYFVVRQADAFGVLGWVRNCRSGDVELMAEGEDENISIFIEKIHQGPGGARISDVIVDEREYIGEFRYFDVHPSV